MAHGVCPWWMGYVLLNPLRRWGQNPQTILGPLVGPGQTALDVGSAMGFFSLPLARLVGPSGRVVCVDLQPRMIRSLERRALKAGVADRIDARQCTADRLAIDDLAGAVDLALAFAVVHEAPDAARLLAEIATALRPGGRLLLAEPRGHVGPDEWRATLDAARRAGLELLEAPRIRRSRSALLVAPETERTIG